MLCPQSKVQLNLFLVWCKASDIESYIWFSSTDTKGASGETFVKT